MHLVPDGEPRFMRRSTYGKSSSRAAAPPGLSGFWVLELWDCVRLRKEDGRTNGTFEATEHRL